MPTAGSIPTRDKPHLWCKTIEGLGNKNWIAEWMYRFAREGRTYYDAIGFDTAMMAVNDCIAQGALPVIFEDLIDAGDSEWFHDAKRGGDLPPGSAGLRGGRHGASGGKSAALNIWCGRRRRSKSAPALAAR